MVTSNAATGYIAKISMLRLNIGSGKLSSCMLSIGRGPVSYTHLRAHETDSYLVCRLLLEKLKEKASQTVLATPRGLPPPCLVRIWVLGQC